MITLEPCRKEHLKELKALYMTAFPKEERAPWWLMKLRANQGRADSLAATVDGEFAGMAYMVTRDDMAYLFYLAVEQNIRGKGTGSAILKALGERYAGKRIFLSREQLDSSAPNYAQRESRHRFYLSNGLSDWGIQIKEGPMIYDVMGTGDKVVTAAEYDALMRSWVGRMPKRLFNAYVIE